MMAVGGPRSGLAGEFIASGVRYDRGKQGRQETRQETPLPGNIICLCVSSFRMPQTTGTKTLSV